MARPVKKGLSSFAFDTDFFSDPRIAAISGEFAVKGQVVVVRLLCEIYRNGYFIIWADPLRTDLSRSMPGISVALLDTIVSRLVRIAFFDSGMFAAYSVLTSRDIQLHFRAACARLHRKCPIIRYSLIETDNQTTNGTPPSSPVPAAPPAPVPAPASLTHIPLQKGISALKSDSIWGETVCMRYSIPNIGELKKVIDDFSQYCVTYGETTHIDMKHIKRHFCAWLAKRRQSQHSQPKQQDTLPSSDYTFNGGFGGKDI